MFSNFCCWIYIFFISKLIFFKQTPPLYGKNKNYASELFDSLNEALWCTDHNANNLSSLRSPISEKIKKKPQKMGIFEKMSFLPDFPDFFRNETLQRAEVFLRCNQCIKTLHRGPAPLYSYPETDLPSGISS